MAPSTNQGCNHGDQTESGTTYGYSNENLLSSSSGSAYATLHYDAAMRLYQIASAATTRFAYDGTDAIAEYRYALEAPMSEIVIAVLGGPVTLGALAIGVGVNAYDRYSGGKVTRFLNRQLAHLELRIGEGCQ